MSRPCLGIVVLVLVATASLPLRAQPCLGQGNATLRFTPAIIGGPFTATLGGTPSSPVVWYVDTAPASIPLPGIGTVCLAATPDLTLLLDSTVAGPLIPPNGSLPVSFNLPGDPGLFATVLYSQFASLDAGAPNGVALSTPASLQFSAGDVHLPTLGTLSTWRGLHTTTPLASGRFTFIAGGGIGILTLPSPVATTDMYDHYTRTFSAGPSMSVARVLHTATLLNNGKILITGGLDGIATNNWSDGELYDPLTNAFTPVLNQMQNPRAGHTATLLNNGKVLITGGNTIFAVAPNGSYIQIFSSVTSSTELYDPVTNTFTPGPAMSGPRFGHEALTLPNGRVLLVGGINGAINLIITAIPTYTTSTIIYDPVANSFAASGSTPVGRLKPLLYLLPSGAVFSGGGANGPTLATTNTAEIRNPTTGNWSATTPMPQGVVLAGSTRLPNGAFVVQGGGQGALANFTPTSAVFTYTEGPGYTLNSSLPVPLMNHTLSPLDDGTYLLSGGVGSVLVAVNTALVWTR